MWSCGHLGHESSLPTKLSLSPFACHFERRDKGHESAGRVCGSLCLSIHKLTLTQTRLPPCRLFVFVFVSPYCILLFLSHHRRHHHHHSVLLLRAPSPDRLLSSIVISWWLCTAAAASAVVTVVGDPTAIKSPPPVDQLSPVSQSDQQS